MYCKLFVFVCIAACVTATAIPATTKEQLDKVTGADVAANAVVPTATNNNDSKKADYVVVETASAEDRNKEEPPASTIEISGIQTGYQTPASPLDPGTPFKPQRAGSMFARLIDDIFQIPINVLQNVAKLITNPFNQNKNATPEPSGRY